MARFDYYTGLYEKLAFVNNPEKLNQALALFNNNQQMGDHIRYLFISALDIDVQVVLSLLQLFPKIRTLAWAEELNCVRFINDPTKAEYQQVLQNWRDIESMENIPKHLQISTNLLSSGICPKLTHLEIKFGDYTVQERYNRFMLGILISNIHNAPSLQHITLGETSIKLNGLEHLHNVLPELSDVKLNGVYLYGEDVLDSVVDCPATELHSLDLDLCARTAENMGTMQFHRTLVNWLNYIRQKYQSVGQLELSFCNGVRWSQSTALQEQLVRALSNMKQIAITRLYCVH